MKLNKTIIIIILGFSTIFNGVELNAQTVNSKENKIAFQVNLPEFLIGMFNDYNGKDFILNHPKESNLVTDFFSSESVIAKIFVDSLNVLAEQRNASVEVNNKTGVSIYSPELSLLFREYYKIKKKPKNYYLETMDSKVEYGVHSGKLKKGKFDTKFKKLSFLLGAVLRYGKFIDERKIRFSFANSPNHYRITKKFFKALNFKIIDEDGCKNGYIPCTKFFTVIIHPKYQNIFIVSINKYM